MGEKKKRSRKSLSIDFPLLPVPILSSKEISIETTLNIHQYAVEAVFSLSSLQSLVICSPLSPISDQSHLPFFFPFNPQDST